MKSGRWTVASQLDCPASCLFWVSCLYYSLVEPSGTITSYFQLQLSSSWLLTVSRSQSLRQNCQFCLQGLVCTVFGSVFKAGRERKGSNVNQHYQKRLTLLSSMMKLPPNKALPKHFHNPVKIQCIILKMIYVYVKFYNSTLLMLGINSL